jgi:hypothetical protein
MDLIKCPKCGARWPGGERCVDCGFVAIGAGLKGVPKKKKRKARYVEPGSSKGLLLTIFLGAGVYASYAYQPWQDDWEPVRALMGQGRRHSLVGEWEIVKTVQTSQGAPLLPLEGVKNGVLSFDKDGDIRMIFESQQGEATAKGKYVVSGQLVTLNGLSSESQSFTVPPNLLMQLAWTGPDRVVAACGKSEALYLRKRDDQHPLVQIMKFGLKPGAENEAPGAIRGMVTTMQNNIDKAGN